MRDETTPVEDFAIFSSLIHFALPTTVQSVRGRRDDGRQNFIGGETVKA